MLVLAGFPIALILAWAFDVGAGGIRMNAGPARRRRMPARSARPETKIFALAVVGLLISALIGYFVLCRAARRESWKNRSPSCRSRISAATQANAYFADGIQDDILTNLAKISDLKVISRTSVMPYRGQTHNIREIGKALNVATILEGSVRREGKRVRINVQLIDATTDRHLWAQVYDRELTDVFAIQSELAQEIASALKATLSPSEQERIERKPTENGDAYLLYLEAHEIFGRPDRHHDDLARVEALYEKAIQLDPTFALAHARLSQVAELDVLRDRAAAGPGAESAGRGRAKRIRLQPDLPETHLAHGLRPLLRRSRLRRGAERVGDRAARVCRTMPGVFRAMAAIQRRQGKWDESSASYAKAVSLDPKDPILLENMGMNYLAVRDYATAARIFDRAVKAAPETFTIRELRARVDFYSKGDLRPMQALLAACRKTSTRTGRSRWRATI